MIHIAIYAIAKDEAHFAERFARSVCNADQIVVCDTGSQDGTIRLLRKHGVTVHEIQVSPFRFDLARNMALTYVDPEIDVCVSMDLDEVALPGWRKIIEEAWEEDVTMLRYPFVHSWADPEQRIPKLSVWGFKVHARHGYLWQYPIHEVLVWVDKERPEKQKVIHQEIIRHYPDPHKQERFSRIAIFERWIKDYWDDPRMVYLYARELSFHGIWDKAEEVYRRYLEITKTYPPLGHDEEAIAETRAKACLGLAKCLVNQGKDINEAGIWVMRALGEAPWIREIWVEAAQFFLAVGDGTTAFAFLRRAEKLSERLCSSEINELAWDENYLRALEAASFQQFLQDELKRGEFIRGGDVDATGAPSHN